MQKIVVIFLAALLLAVLDILIYKCSFLYHSGGPGSDKHIISAEYLSKDLKKDKSGVGRVAEGPSRLVIPLENAISIPKDARSFLFSIVYLDSDDNIESSRYVQSLLLLKEDLHPFELVIIGYSRSESKLTYKLPTNNVHVSSASLCLSDNYKLPFINCLMDISFKAVDALFRKNNISDAKSFFLVESNFNLYGYFTPNFASSIVDLTRKFGGQFCGVVSQLIMTNKTIIKEIENLSKTDSLSIEKIRGLEADIMASKKSIVNNLIVRNIFQALVLIFPQEYYPLIGNTFPNYLIDGSNAWGHHLMDYFHEMLPELPTIDITDGAFFIGNKKSKFPYVYNLKATKKKFGIEFEKLGQLMLSKLQLVECPHACKIVLRKEEQKKNFLGLSSINSNIDALSKALQVAYANFIEDAIQRKESKHLVTIMAVSENSLDAMLNWLCWAKGASFSSYVIVTYSTLVLADLRKLGVPVHYFPLQSTINNISLQGGDASLSSEMLMVAETSNFLGELHLILLQNKIKALITTPYLITLNDITPKIASNACDVIISMEAPESMCYINPSLKGKQLLRSLIKYRNTFPIQADKDFKNGIYQYDLYKNFATVNQMQSLNLVVCKISKGNVYNGDYYFKYPSKRFGTPPSAINLNIPEVNKYLTIYNNESKTCEFPRVLESIPVNERKNWKLRIRILTSYRAKSLKRLLNSLLSAHYETNMSVISVDIVVDFPKISTLDADYLDKVNHHKLAAQAAKDFKWPYGPVNVSIHEYCHGIVYAWTNSRLGSNEILLVLEDDIEMSPYYYKYILKAIDHFYVNPENYNPRLFSLSLQRQYHVVGESINSFYDPYGRKVIDLGLDGIIYYKYQLVSSWGPLFFPKPWNSFIDWAHAKIESKNLVQCVPFLYSNKWAIKGDVWTPLASRFIFEEGLYIIYHHSPDGVAFITNHKEAGLHFEKKESKEKSKNDVVPLLKDINHFYRLLHSMPPASTLQLYDFHFKTVSSELALQLRNKVIDHGLDDPCITVSRKDMKRKKDNNNNNNNNAQGSL